MGSAQEPLWVMIGGDRSHSNSSANARGFGGRADWNPYSLANARSFDGKVQGDQSHSNSLAKYQRSQRSES